MFAAVGALVVEHKVSRSRNRRHNLWGARVLSPHQFTRAHLRAAARQTPPMAPSAAAAAVGAAAREHTVGMGREGAHRKGLESLSVRFAVERRPPPVLPLLLELFWPRGARITGVAKPAHLPACPLPRPQARRLPAAYHHCCQVRGRPVAAFLGEMNSAQLNTSNPAIRRILSEIKKLVRRSARLPLRLIACCARGSSSDACLRG
jgi:hypothetical protein